MTTPSDLSALVLAALRLPTEQRDEFIEWACGNDDKLKELLKQEIELAVIEDREADKDSGASRDEGATSPFAAQSREAARATHTGSLTADSSTDDSDFFISLDDETPEVEFRPGLLIEGRYKLIRKIGEGGMGTVWVAEQFEPVRRQVAIKLIKAGGNSSHVVARFEAERQALAVMDHPNIARILDGGSIARSGVPYFVMELVKGIPITQYCDRNRLTLTRRIELFIPVCEAIQHAHQKGIIHRDIKPSNILVTEIDGRPAARVIDFGVAKAVGLALTDKSLNTVIGAIVGTPQYMSPEQADPDFADIDTRSDVYSLGILLYELLTGAPPFDARKLGRVAILEVLRFIREVDPPTPSSKLSTDEGLPAISANRSMEPARLTRMVRGEMDWIVMKSLEKERSRRYESASRLADDLRRFLAGEQISAAPPSRWYSWQKFVRRNRAMVTATGVVIAGLAVALVVSVTSRNQAILSAKQAEAAREMEASQRALAEQAQRDETAQRLVAEKATAQAFAALQSFSDDFIERRFMSQKYLGSADRQLLSKALEQWEAFAAVQGSSVQAMRVQAEGLFRVSKLRQLLGEPGVEAGYRESVRLLNLATASASEDASLQQSLAEVSVALGKSLLKSGESDDAMKFADQGLRAAKAARAIDDSVSIQLAEANAENARAVILRTLKKTSEALRAYRSAQDLLETIYNKQTKIDGSAESLASIYNNTGNLLVEMGQFSEAEKEYRDGLAIRQRLVAEMPGEPEYLHGLGLSWYGLGDLSSRMGNIDQSLKHYQLARDTFRQLVDRFPQNPEYWDQLANVIRNLSSRESQANKLAQSVTTLRDAVSVRSTLIERFPDYPGNARDLANDYTALAKRLDENERLDEAAEAYEKAVEVLRKVAASNDADVVDRSVFARTLVNAGMAANRQQKNDQADKLIEEGLRIFEALPRNLLQVQADRSEGHWWYGVVLAQREEWGQAVENFDIAVEILNAMIRAEPDNIRHRATLRLVLMRIAEKCELAEQWDSAIRFYRSAAGVAGEICQKLPDGEEHVVEHAGVFNRLALVQASTGKPEEAIVTMNQSNDLLTSFLQRHTDSIDASVLRSGNRINRCDIESSQLSHAERLETLTLAIDELNAALQKKPNHRTGLMFLHNGLLRRAQLLDSEGQFGEAAADWHTLSQLPNSDDPVMHRSKSAQSMVRDGQVEGALEVMESLAKVENPATIFARARVFALAYGHRPEEELAEQCVVEIERLVKMGFNDAARLRADPDLKSIQEFEPFRQLVKRIEGG